MTINIVNNIPARLFAFSVRVHFISETFVKTILSVKVKYLTI